MHELVNRCWAIRPDVLKAMAAGDIKPRTARSRLAVSGTAIRVIPVLGSIGPRGSDFTWSDVGTDDLRTAIGQAVADLSVGAIILDIDSPGGDVSDVPELAADIRRAAERKTIVAIANTEIASAAYWIGTAASKLYMSPSAEAGSIGVWALHMDMSRALDRAGITPTFISAGKYKVETAGDRSLSTGAREHMQARVDDYYGMFIRDAATNRRTSVARVERDFGQGRMFGADEAVSKGMADRVLTKAQLITQLQGRLSRATRSASADPSVLRRIADAR